MPIIKSHGKLVYYAHVPKCGGSAVASYLESRFGRLAFYDPHYRSKANDSLAWSRTSPQHIDVETLKGFVPTTFFDETFSIVRHPVGRLVSTFHFQREVEKSIPSNVTFGNWLHQLECGGLTRWSYDNHVLPADEIVPETAQVFHLEHGLDDLVRWLDEISGRAAPPRAVLPENERGAHGKVSSDKVIPTSDDLERIGRLYAKDFQRFGYRLHEKQPTKPRPVLSDEAIWERDRELRLARHPTRRLLRRLRKRMRISS